MPELQEVEHFRKYIDKNSLAKKTEALKLLAPKMLLEITERQLKKKLSGKEYSKNFPSWKIPFF